MGLLLKAKVVPANWSETDVAMVALEGLELDFPRLELVWADQRPCPPAIPPVSAPSPLGAALRGKTGAFYGQEGCVLWSRQGFEGWEFSAWMKGSVKWDLELTSGLSKPGQLDFRPAPWRWVVERSINWDF